MNPMNTNPKKSIPEPLTLPDFFDSDPSDQSSDQRELNLTLPDFIDDSLPSPLLSHAPIEINLPELTPSQAKARSHSSKQQKLQVAHLIEPSRPSSPPDLEQLPLNLSDLTPVVSSERECNPTQIELNLPPLQELSRPHELNPTELPAFSLPKLISNNPPQRELILKKSVSILEPLTSSKKLPSFLDPLISDITPERDLISIEIDYPLQRDKKPKHNHLNIAFDEVNYHPTLRRLHKLIETKSYDEIIQEAWRSGSTADAHHLLTSPLLKQRYAKQLMGRLCIQAPNLLPRSTTFSTKLENDQEQINKLTKMCQRLVEVNEWKKVQSIFKQHSTLEQHPMLKHLIEQCQKLSQFETSEQQGLLQLKRNIYCFLVDILRQEEEAIQQYLAEQKNLVPLREGLALLASHIQTSSEALKMGFIREATILDFSPWEDRKPVNHSTIKLEPQDIPGGPDFDACLQALQSGKLKGVELQNLTTHVLRMGEGNEQERAKKIQYLLKISNFYFNAGTPAALKQAICWVELAMTILKDYVNEDHPLLLSCYERRGTVRLKMAGKVETIATYDNTVPRKHMDVCYRDFHHSLPLSKNCEVNFVRKADDVRECVEFNYAQAELSQACQIDENYAEAHYLYFLKEYEQLKLDTPKMLHPQFESIETTSPTATITDFRNLIIRLTSDLVERSLFKIISGNEVLYIQFTHGGIAFDQPGIEIAASILNRGIQKVKILPSHQKKIYFSQPISEQQFYKLVCSHADNNKRLQEVEQGIQSFEEFELSAFYKTSIQDSPEPLTMRSIQSHLDKKLPIHVINLNIQAMNHHILNGKKGVVSPFRSSNKTQKLQKTITPQKREIGKFQRKIRHEFTGILHGESLHFKKITIAGDGNCGFSSLGVTRKEVRDVLIGCSENSEIRQRLQSEVLEAFIARWLNPTSGFNTLYNSWNKYQTALDTVFREIRDTILNLPHFEKKSVQQSIDWLNANQHPIKGQALQEAKQCTLEAYQALLDYCGRHESYENYCENYLHGQWLGYGSAVIYAEQQQFELRIWERAANHNELQIKTRTPPPQDQQRPVKDILFSMGSHFDRLSLITPTPLTNVLDAALLEISEFVIQPPPTAEEPLPSITPEIREECNEARDCRSESFASALVYACRAISSCDQLLSVANNPEIEKMRFKLLIKRAFIYKELKLLQCHIRDLEEVLAIARRESPHYLNPSIHYALYQAYTQQRRTQEAREQAHTILAVRGTKKGKKIIRNIDQKKEESKITSEEKISSEDEEEATLIAQFQDGNIQEECLQVLRNNQRANSLFHPHRKVPVWETLAQQLGRTTTIKDFCEILFSSILIKGNIDAENLLHIAKLSNLQLKDLSFLDQLKSYVQDAIETYREEEKRFEDKIIAQLEEIKIRVLQEIEFLQFKNALKQEIKNGKWLLPKSKIRQQISSFSTELEMDEEELNVNNSIRKIFGEGTTFSYNFDGINNEIRQAMYKELSEILENALDLEVSPPKVENRVLHIRGNNLFMSQIIDQIYQICARDKSIRDVHILGIHVYVDKSIKLNGINVAIGGEYVQFIQKDGPENKISIDLSGRDGVDGKQTPQGEAIGGTTFGQDGSKGQSGDDGKGGQPGGDFCLKYKDPIVGFTSEIIGQINLNGGKGGKGSDGQKGGKGADGKEGEDGRQDVRGGDLADTDWHGYIDSRAGGKAIPSGSGGRGGDGGIGGKGGKHGRFLAEGIDRTAVPLQENDGADGGDGNYGEGGNSGAAKRDGFHCIHVKGGFFSKRQTIIGIQPYHNRRKSDRDKDGWSFHFTVEESIRNNQRQSQGRGKSADQQLNEGKKRDAENKNDLKRDVFNANHAVHLHTQSAEQKADALDAVTNRLSQAQETEEIVREQLAAKQHKLEYIDTLIQTTAAILHQAQTEQQATTQHSRIATLNNQENKGDIKKEIADLLNKRLKDQESLLPLWEYSPVVREPNKFQVRAIDIAIHHVNVTKGQNIRSIADLIVQIGELPRRKYVKDPVKLALLIEKLSIMIRQLPSHLAVDGWSQLKTAVRELKNVTILAQIVEEKDSEVSTFAKIIEREEQHLHNLYREESQRLILEKGMLRLLQRNFDHYLYLTQRTTSKEERSKRKSWFQGQLYQKVYNYLHYINREKWDNKKRYKPSQDEINWCLNFINDYLKRLKVQIVNKENFKKTLSDAFKERNPLLKRLNNRYTWISERISQMAIHQYYPSKMIQDDHSTSHHGGLTITNSRLEKLYLQCVNIWSTLPSIGIINEAASSTPSLPSSSTKDLPQPARYERFINNIKKEEWTQVQLNQLESHVKQLITLKSIVGDVTRYLEFLENIYAEGQQDGLLEILIELIRSSEKWKSHEQIFERCVNVIQELKTNDLAKIHALRQNYLKLLTIEGAQLQDLKRAVDCYLQTRHVLLTKKACLDWLKENKPQMLEDEESMLILTQLLLKANDLFKYRDFLPHTDFLKYAYDVFEDYARQAIPKKNDRSLYTPESTSSSTSKPVVEKDDLFQTVLKLVFHVQLHSTVKDLLENKNKIQIETKSEIIKQSKSYNLNNIQEIIDQFREALNNRDIHQINGLLFILLNLNLSYPQLVQMTQLLQMEAYEKLLNVKEALSHFIQKMILEKVKFEQKWQSILERAKEYDHVRRQLDENDRLSIEEIILQISQEANLLSPEETAEVLEEMVSIISRSGCFMIPLELKEIQHRLITQIGCFTNTTSNSERLEQYNRELNIEFKRKNDATDSHEKEIITQTSTEAASSSEPLTASCSTSSPNPLEALAMSFMRIVEELSAQDNFLQLQRDFLQPCFIAIHHLPLTPNDRITLYCTIERLLDCDLTEELCEFKKQCLNDIRDTLIETLKTDFTKLYENRESIISEIEKKQQRVLKEIGDTLNQSHVLHAERHLAKLDLWFKQINYHYEFTSPTDREGSKRKELCQTIIGKFKENIERSSDTETALAAFNLWLRQEFEHQTGINPSLDYFEELITSMRDGNEQRKREAKTQFTRAFWRDLIPYYSEDENKDTVLRRMEGQQLDVDIAKLIKLKLDDQLLRDESYQVRKELEDERGKISQKLGNWISSVEKRLSSDPFSEEKLTEIFPSAGLLPQIMFGESPIPDHEESNRLTAQEVIENMNGQSSEPQKIPDLHNALPKIKEYLQDLDKRLNLGEVSERDIKLVNTLKNVFREISSNDLPEIDSFRKTIAALELSLIDFNDFKNKFKQKAMNDFIDKINQVNNTGVASSSSSTPAFSDQYEKNLAKLKKTLASCCTLMGEDLFTSILEKLTDAIQSHRKPIDLKMLFHLFWVLPRLKDLSILLEVIKTKSANKWALALLEHHCLEEFSVPLSQMMSTFSPVEMNEKTPQQKDAFVEDLVKQKRKICEGYAKTFTKALNRLVSATELTLRQKEDLFQFLAVRLSFVNHNENGFTLNHFIDLIDKYLTEVGTLKKLSKEFYKIHSFNRELFFEPSLQSFKYGLTLTWIQGELEDSLTQLNEQQQEQLFDALFQIETSKKEEIMRSVVQSLKGKFLSPAVVECVVNFAQEIWLLNNTTLEFLKKRTADNGWYYHIEEHTKISKSQKRDLKTLVQIMANEGQGINRSIYPLLTSKNEIPSQLEKDIRDINQLVIDTKNEFDEGLEKPASDETIKAHHSMNDIPSQLEKDIRDINQLVINTKNEFDEGLKKPASDETIKAHRSMAVKKWARAFKGERCLDNPENLKKAIAVVSIANEITEKYLLRETQLIAIWLTLRPEGERDRGRIGQVSTGEGKSFIFAGLSVLRALTGSYVDVITTSYILATKDSGEEKRPFFELFDLTISNNCDREAEANEEARKSRYYGENGPVNIVYGEVGSFERDILLTEFHGKKIIHEERLKGNRTVLVDEVDGLFLDSAGMVLYLSHNVDSLKFLRRIFVQIFAIVNQPSLAQAGPWDDHVVAQIVPMIKQKLTSGEITLPKYVVPQAAYMQMQDIIDRKLSTWIRSALHAKMLNVNNEYIITDVITGNKKKQSITVMDKGTGVEQFSLKWSDGLYLFLQLKHGLELSDDSLKAVFLSNYHFFKRYGQHIYGLSGTLGSNTEQKYLEDLYHIDLCKIPRFSGEKLIKYKANVMGTYDEWINAIRQCVHRQTKELKRAVLVICNTIDEVEIIKNELKKDHPFLLSFERSHQAFEESTFISNEKKKPMDCGDVVVATNLAGRGTDITTTKLLENRGGLHVIMSFLPDNIRIEEQGFGRTGRSGNEGSGEFIIMDPKRRPITELCRERDYLEQQRLEVVAKKELKKIEFEHDLLRGFTHRGKRGETTKVIGFQKILENIEESLQGEDPCYRKAQLDSLNNRWAFWIDHMNEKINLVDIIGKEAVIASFENFHRGVKADFNAGGFRLIKEPVELIKLGGEFRRQENWTRAMECYDEAAKDTHYAYVRYYKAACQLILSPANDNDARHRFIEDAQAASLAIKPEINHLQTAIQSIAPLVEQRQKLHGDPDYGNPFKARSEEMIQIWSIFQSAIDSAIGGSLTEAAFKSTSYVDEKGARKLLARLKGVNRYQDSQLVGTIDTKGNQLSCQEKTLRIPEMFKAALANWEGREINRKMLIRKCKQLMTHEKMKKDLEALGCRSHPIYQLSRLPLSFDWDAHGHYSEHEKFILWNIVLECEPLNFKTKEEISETLTKKIKANEALAKVNIASFCQMMLDDKHKLVIEDHEYDLKGVLIKEAPLEFKSAQELKERYSESCTDEFNALPENFKALIIKTAAIKKTPEDDETGLQSTWSLQTSIRISHLPLAKNATDAAEIIWATLEEQDLIELPKVKLHFGNVKEQLDSIKNTVQDFFKDHDQAKEAVDAIFNIIDSSVGMIYRLDDKNTTAKFADIIRKYYYDHSKGAPEGLGFFVELGLEVIADLIEKKDPPAWFEVLAVTVMGVLQIVAGAIIKAYLPVVGELIGNALISSGMDDIMFAITSAVNGEFSWSDYASAKAESLKRSLISSAISCGVSFGVNSVQLGVDQAWDVQKLSGLEKAALAGNRGINIGSYVLNEMKQTFISTGISQVASRGLDGMTKIIASSYEDKVEEGIQNAVNAHWHVVQAQAQALYNNIRGEKSAADILKECMSTSLKKAQASEFFDGAIRASRQVLPQASNLVGEGWGTFLSKAPDLAQLGVSIPKLINLVEDNLHLFAREIRSAKERLVAQGGETTPSKGEAAKQAFNHELDARKEEYVRTLKESFTGILNGAVYAPLVSMGTQKLVEWGKDLICPLSEAEKKAQSAAYLSKALAVSHDPNQAFLDGPARWWAGANDEVVELTEKQLKEIPENAEASIETLQKQYGSLLKVYKDKDGHLFVQRPTRDEYAQAVRENKASGDPELLALSKITHKNIAVHTSDGKMKTYFQDGTITITDGSTSSPNTIELNLETNPSTGIGHIKPQGMHESIQQSSAPDREMNCLYDAIISSGNGGDMDVRQLREATAQTITADPDCKRFYHDWSIDNEAKQFAGQNPVMTAINGIKNYFTNVPHDTIAGEAIAFIRASDPLVNQAVSDYISNIQPTLGRLINIGSYSAQVITAIDLTIVSGGSTAPITLPILIHGLDNLQAELRSFHTGTNVSPYIVQFLHQQVHLSHQNAELVNSLAGFTAGIGMGALARALPPQPPKFPTITKDGIGKTNSDFTVRGGREPNNSFTRIPIQPPRGLTNKERTIWVRERHY